MPVDNDGYMMLKKDIEEFREHIRSSFDKLFQLIQRKWPPPNAIVEQDNMAYDESARRPCVILHGLQGTNDSWGASIKASDPKAKITEGVGVARRNFASTEWTKDPLPPLDTGIRRDLPNTSDLERIAGPPAAPLESVPQEAAALSNISSSLPTEEPAPNAPRLQVTVSEEAGRALQFTPAEGSGVGTRHVGEPLPPVPKAPQASQGAGTSHVGEPLLLDTETSQTPNRTGTRHVGEPPLPDPKTFKKGVCLLCGAPSPLPGLQVEETADLQPAADLPPKESTEHLPTDIRHGESTDLSTDPRSSETPELQEAPDTAPLPQHEFRSATSCYRNPAHEKTSAFSTGRGSVFNAPLQDSMMTDNDIYGPYNLASTKRGGHSHKVTSTHVSHLKENYLPVKQEPSSICNLARDFCNQKSPLLSSSDVVRGTGFWTSEVMRMGSFSRSLDSTHGHGDSASSNMGFSKTQLTDGDNHQASNRRNNGIQTPSSSECYISRGVEHTSRPLSSSRQTSRDTASYDRVRYSRSPHPVSKGSASENWRATMRPARQKYHG